MTLPDSTSLSLIHHITCVHVSRSFEVMWGHWPRMTFGDLLSLNPRQWRAGWCTSSPSGFSKLAENGVFSVPIGAFFAQLLEKEIDRVMSVIVSVRLFSVQWICLICAINKEIHIFHRKIYTGAQNSAEDSQRFNVKIHVAHHSWRRHRSSCSRCESDESFIMRYNYRSSAYSIQLEVNLSGRSLK